MLTFDKATQLYENLESILVLIAYLLRELLFDILVSINAPNHYIFQPVTHAISILAHKVLWFLENIVTFTM